MAEVSREFKDVFGRAVKQKLTTMRRTDPAVQKFCMEKLEAAASKGALMVELPGIIEKAVLEFDGVPV